MKDIRQKREPHSRAKRIIVRLTAREHNVTQERKDTNDGLREYKNEKKKTNNNEIKSNSGINNSTNFQISIACIASQSVSQLSQPTLYFLLFLFFYFYYYYFSVHI